MHAVSNFKQGNLSKTVFDIGLCIFNVYICCLSLFSCSLTLIEIPDCGTNFTLENGYADFHKKDTIYKSRVQVYCRPGFNMRGNDYITCGINGTWSNDTECYPVGK